MPLRSLRQRSLFGFAILMSLTGGCGGESRDAHVDAGGSDAATNDGDTATSDAGTDAGIDSGTDGGTDAGTDAAVGPCATLGADAYEPDDEASPIAAVFQSGPISFTARTLSSGDVDAFTATIPGSCVTEITWSTDDANADSTVELYIQGNPAPVASAPLKGTGTFSFPSAQTTFDAVVVVRANTTCQTYSVTVALHCS
jgi:hypothetical protein